MNFSNIQEVFDYLSSIEGVKVYNRIESCDIWLPNGKVLEGKFVDPISEISYELLIGKNSFIYNDKQIAWNETFVTIEFCADDLSSLLLMCFSFCPEIVTNDYMLEEDIRSLENSIRELTTLRVEIGGLKRSLTELVEKSSRLEQENNLCKQELNRLKKDISRKETTLYTFLIQYFESNSDVSLRQLENISLFIEEKAVNKDITIETEINSCVFRLTYNITIWESGDLEGIPFGTQSCVEYFNGSKFQEVSDETFLKPDIIFGWNELKFILNYFKSKDSN